MPVHYVEQLLDQPPVLVVGLTWVGHQELEKCCK